MPVQLVGRDGNPWTPKDMDASGQNVVRVYGKLSFTGSYTTAVGGDTLDLSPCQSYVPSALLPDEVDVVGQGASAGYTGGGNYFAVISGAALNAYKLKLFAAGGAEEGTATYASLSLNGAGADSVSVELLFRKNLN